jgi:anti-anti-sigma factor
VSDDSRVECILSGDGLDGFGWSQRPGEDGVVVAVTGDLDLITAGEFESRLHALARSGSYAILLDLSGVGFIDAHSIGVIVGAWAAARVRGHSLCVTGLHGLPARLFRVFGLQMMTVHPPQPDIAEGHRGGRP